MPFPAISHAPTKALMNAGLLIAIGFFVYGPQMLVGVAAADYASNDAVATATGLTGLFGYVGSAACSVGTGVIADKYGWDGGFLFFAAAALCGTFLFALTWNKRSDLLADSIRMYHRERSVRVWCGTYIRATL